jgi:hypothetical protein
MNKFAMVTRCDENAKILSDVTHDILKDYAGQWGCDFIVLDSGEWSDYEMAHYRILEVGELLEKYERIVVIDTDVLILPGCPNPFETVPEDKIGSIYEDKGSRQAMRQGVIMSIQERFGDVGWEEGYINTGFFVVSRRHADIFQLIDNQYWTGFGFDDALLGFNIHKFGHEVFELEFKWNHMAMFSETWNFSASRFNSYIIHYAGLAQFPDDLSGRGIVRDNKLEHRLKLIQSDMDRITEGLMDFTDAVPCEVQGMGSKTIECSIGVQKKRIILKMPNTPECLSRELEVLDMRIPNTVTFLGMGEDAQGGKFIMLEKLEPLPEVLTEREIVEIATVVLITMRQLWKLGIPWICRSEHIMLDEYGKVKLLDFGDDPYMPIPFYQSDDEQEAIIMDGECCQDGKYQMRFKYPLSGYVAVMKHLCDVNDVDWGVLHHAEKSMVAYEYQSLADVHQPINHDEYKDIMRTESERDDKNYGYLVPANRECEDRAKMIIEHAEPWMMNETTWLDVGCNVGWFCLEFSGLFNMSGVERDINKVIFAKMIAEGERKEIDFRQGEMNKTYADEMPEFDVISVMSMMHLELVRTKDMITFWSLFTSITAKAKKAFYFEFPPFAVQYLNIVGFDNFIKNVAHHGGFKKVEQIGVTDAGRPMLKCLK